MSNVTLGVVQTHLSGGLEDNLGRLESLIREAASRGANIVLTPELVEGPYFCKTQDVAMLETATPIDEHLAVARFAALAEELGVVLPVSVFERADPYTYNSLVMIDADGDQLGVYRKSHIPDGPGYQEKFYFRPGDTGFKVWETRFGRIGAGICWDQWFPEAARAMMLKGADLLLYPTAIGSEPYDEELDTSDRWQRVQQGHAAANCVPVAAANRIGREGDQVFYGRSFISDETGAILSDAKEQDGAVLLASFDFEGLRHERKVWGFFRDRRPDLYSDLTDL